VSRVFAHTDASVARLGISRNILRTHLKHFGLIGSEPHAADIESSDSAAEAAG
jgi:hypothetical protein